MELRLEFREDMPFSHKFCHLSLTLIVILLCNVAQAKIIKWVDEKGVTHYSDQLPSQYAGHSNSEISQRDVTLKQNKPADTKAVQFSQEKQEQDKKDKALLASYTTVQEIDLARDRNLQLDLATMQNLTQQKQALEKRGAALRKTSDDLIKLKKPLPVNVATDLASYKADSAKIDAQITERKTSMDQTKQHYATEKARFIILKSDASNVADTSTAISLPAAPVPIANTKPVSTNKSAN